VQLEKLERLGIRDSKQIRDTVIQRLAKELKSLLARDQYEILILNPEKYNEMHSKLGNLNKILGWGHTRIIERLLLKNQNCKTVVCDKV